VRDGDAHISRMAEDVILWSSEEFGFFEIDDSVATGSSLMPQKKNPDPLELVRGKSGKAIGLLTGWLTTLKGLPLGYNKDLQEDKAIAFEAEDLTVACASTTATVVRTLALRRDRARQAASGLLLATEVADYLVGRGVPFRTAHEITGRIVRDLYQAGRDFRRSRSPIGAVTATCSKSGSLRRSHLKRPSPLVSLRSPPIRRRRARSRRDARVARRHSRLTRLRATDRSRATALKWRATAMWYDVCHVV
jgi:argininosuccinate lyase